MNEREQAQQHAARLEAIAERLVEVDARRELRYAATFLRALADRPEQPIDMVLHCPKCGLQHVDAPETGIDRHIGNPGVWSNPPHRSHLCHQCGHIWRPADVPTNGVAAIKTAGKADSPIAPQEPAQPVAHAGMKLVPLVADTKMADAMDLAVLRYSADGEYDPTATMRAMYAAALAAAPSRPAPSEAAPERQDGRTLLAAAALVQWWARAKNPPLPNDWNAHLGRLQEDLMAAVNAQPAKREGK